MNKKTGLHHLMRSLVLVLLVFTLLPFSALAVTENTLETASDITLPEIIGAEESVAGNEQDYLPSFWENTVKGSSSDLSYYTPWMTGPEEQRAGELMAALKTGKISASDYPTEKPSSGFTVGVYPLDPADFAGETFFVTLPDHELTDAELVALISGFESLGLPFDPASLNEKNCRRYYDLGASRALTSLEAAQMKELERMVIYGILEPGDIRPETECRVIFTGNGPFPLYPYRKMTENELAAFALKTECAWEDNPDLVLKTAERYASGCVRFPSFLDVYSMERILVPYTDETAGYHIVFAVFSSEEEYLDMSPRDGQPRSAEVWLQKDLDGKLQEYRLIVDIHHEKPSSLSAQYNAVYSASGLSREEMLADAQLWIKNNTLLSGSMDLTGWKIEPYFNNYRVYAVTPDNLRHIALVISETDGTVYTFIVSREAFSE